MIDALVLAALAGAFTKAADDMFDNGKPRKRAGLIFSAVYGLMLLALLWQYPVFISIMMGLLAALIVSGKIDNRAHVIGVGVLVAPITIAGWLFFPHMFYHINAVYLALFFAAGMGDELLSDRADTGKIKGIAGRVAIKRPVLEIAAFAFSLATGVWIVWLGLAMYDCGYIISGWAGTRVL